MSWDWASSLDQIWRTPTFPMWLTLAAAGFLGIIVLITLLRAEKSVANGVLTVMTLLAIVVAVAATIRSFGPDGAVSSAATPVASVSAALPQLSCIDDLAGDAVLNACEKTLFGSADSVAAAVTYAASQITRLTGFGDAATADKATSSDLQALRRAVERDRYGLMAYVLMARDHCTPAACAAFAALADKRQVVANMDERLYENLITRYAPSWNAPPLAATSPGLLAGLPPSMPTGKPTNAEFPSAANTPPISIMNPEPPAARAAPAPAAANQPASPRPAPAAAAPTTAAPATPTTTASPALAAAKKQPPAPKRTPAAPVQLSPAPGAPGAPTVSSTAAAPANE
ncbi:hypothetical protein JQ609_05270 [Bradyrhizobium sp. AUGA SZCCT0169]|uniref:hypothetical protein n=1 Tax=Bradyrhizobium sp. AUGA SZCCT0169 TaxID=2807663 RepID=UPI001BAD7C88|nr:hypothetical protein [Bradyrhizobium sp. AUGA SZCCT0169]MBR1246340.1 hypothetical protein [Bradyrhizobium sp. AUGA SZCCT0169]